MQNDRKITMKDIAQKTGFSINTVSFALRGSQGVSEVSRQKILNTALELGYIGNSIASSMRSGVTKTIAVIQSDISNPYFSRMVRDFVNYLDAHDYRAIIYNTGSDPHRERDAVISAVRQNVDGVLLCPEEKCFEESSVILKRSHVPFVVFTTNVEDPSVTTVCIDEVKGGFLAGKYLLSNGCRNLVLISGPKDVTSARLRMEGFQKGLAHYHLPFREEDCFYAPTLFASEGSRYNQEWNRIIDSLMRNERFDGIVAFSDQIALKVLQGLYERGFKRMPLDNFPIVGFDNIMENFPLPYALSSVSCAKEDMAQVASRLLLQMIRMENAFVPQKVVLDVKVYKRYAGSR